MSFTKALKWSFLSELASKTIQPVVFIVLARLLTPEDFGVMAAALMIIGFSQIFWEAGMGKALIQRQKNIEDAANCAFWVNIALACIIATIFFFIARPVAEVFFQDDRVTGVLKVMTLQILLGAIGSVHTAFLQKNMLFHKLFWVRLATVTLPGLASIPLALGGMGYWALVAGTIVGQTTQVIMLWRMSRWRPVRSFNITVAKEMCNFGAWVAASGLLAWFYLWADSLIVGKYLGTHELGLYRTGNQFAMMIYAFLFAPIVPVLYSHLSKMNQDKERLRKAFEKVLKVLTLVAIPTAFIMFSLSEPIERVIFGEKWQGIGFVIGVMALMHGVSWIVGMNGEVYRAAGKPSYETIVTASTLIVYIGAYLYSIQKGFEFFVWIRLVLAIGAVVLHFMVLRRLLSISFLPIILYLASILVITSMVVLSVYYFVNLNFSGDWIKLLSCGVINFAILGAIIYFIERKKIFAEIMSLAKDRSRK
jgi:O-antigen/teichoic acid export membrane protein